MKNYRVTPERLSPSILDQKSPAGINFCVESFAFPVNDQPESRRLSRRDYYLSFKSYREIIEKFHSTNYYGDKVVFTSKPYKNPYIF